MTAPRKRRSPREAKEAILEAAEALLVRDGPDAVVVQRVAAALGITDAAVHYHFGSRQGLMAALLHHCGRKLVADIAEVAGRPGERLDLAAVSRAMRSAYDARGGGRMAMWLSLAGWTPRGSGMLSSLMPDEGDEAAEARRLIALLNLAHVAVAIMGDTLLRAADLPADEAGREAYLDWVTELVAERLGDRA